MNVIRIIAISLHGLLAVAILALSILPYFAHTATLDYLSGFRFLYLLVALVLSLVLAALCFRRRNVVNITLLLCAAVALLLNWIEIRPFFYRPSPAATISPSPTSLRLITVNLRRHNQSHEEVLAFLPGEEADVAILLEATGDWPTALKPLESELPHHLSFPVQGFEIFSRIPIIDHELRAVGKERGDVRLSLEGGLDLYASHAYPWKAHGEEGLA